MSEKHADGTEIFRKRTPTEEAIEAENRRAAASAIRAHKRREADRLGFDMPVLNDRRAANRRVYAGGDHQLEEV